MTLPRFALPVLGLLLALGGCAAPGATSGTYPPVPPPRAETIPKPPVTATPLLWEPGYWNWTGAGYVWHPGRYVPARRAREHVHARMVAPGRHDLRMGPGALAVSRAGRGATRAERLAAGSLVLGCLVLGLKIAAWG